MNFNLNSMLNHLIPNSDCYCCKQMVDLTQQQPKLLCFNCHSRLPLLKASCPICAMPLVAEDHLSLSNESNLACGSCLKQSPSYSKTVSAFHYEPPINDFITGLKYNAKRHYIPLLCFYLLDAIKRSYIKQTLPELLIPVPLHPKKIRQRGFNQAQQITNNLSRHLKLPVSISSVTRIIHTKAQSSLNADQRKRNLKGAFVVNNNSAIKSKTIAIVDDVITTGTTANELSLQLLAAGAKRVDVWSIARAFPV